jgi:hypothetical protein
VFYFGNAIAEAGNNSADANVTSADELQARANQAFGVPITNRWDYNRDGKVGTADQLLARSHTTIGAAALQLITAPAAGAGASALVTATSGDTPPPTDPPVTPKPPSGSMSATTTTPSSRLAGVQPPKQGPRPTPSPTKRSNADAHAPRRNGLNAAGSSGEQTACIRPQVRQSAATRTPGSVVRPIDTTAVAMSDNWR